MSQSPTQVDHVQQLRDGYEAFGRGDLDAIRSLFAEDIVWHVGGNSSLTGDYKGIDAVFEFFGKLFTETAGTFKNEVHDILANDKHGVALITQSAERNGKSITSNAVHVLHYNDQGQTTESWIYPEKAAETDAFWA
ncbi:MAG TPA: nuclear transport factor 2 family protein [Candidatus Dormibacteraeota bacterium]|nr:nuclear transport factor 2 family protein [Candidatus Dormibacteraeota bacterium]